MNIWRIQLKPEPKDGFTYIDVLNFCKDNDIIGVGWSMIESKKDDYYELRNDIQQFYNEDKKGADRSFKAINAIRKMRPEDLVWKDRVVTTKHRSHDIANFVSANWVHVGTEDSVPGKVINSFCVSSTVQRVCGVDTISKYIWNNLSDDPRTKYNEAKLSKNEFWDMISSEELECLVLLYLQSKGYMIYSSTLKNSTAKYEVIMVSRCGIHLCFPQVKRGSTLLPHDYINTLKNLKDKIVLFSTSENYGYETHP